MYQLIKMSDPGWEMKSDDASHIRWMLEQHVCGVCKLKYVEDEENYDELNKIYALLGTACGAEYFLNDNEED